MNETLKHIQERYSCRKFSPQMPKAEMIQAVAEAGNQAPSSMNRQRWQVIVVRNAQLIAELDAEGMKALVAMPEKTPYGRMHERVGTLFFGAPCVILLTIDPGDLVSAALDCGIVSQNIAIASQAQGLGSCICGLVKLAFAGEKAAYFKEKLRFREDYILGMAVLIGEPTTAGTPHKPDDSKIIYID